MEIYINSLLKNVPIKSCKKINIIMDGGAFSGSYILGGLYYIKEMENENRLRVNKLSGTSIGSLLCVLYKLDNLDFCIKVYDKIREHFRINGNLFILNEILNDMEKLMKEDFFKSCNKKIYISYYNIETNTHIIKCKYDSNKDLCECLFKSCYIPFICGDTFFYKEKFIDGLKPYLFKKGETLFMNLCMDFKCINGMLNIKNEINNSERILLGVLDVHNFFSESKSSSSICYYLKEMTIIQKSLYFLRIIFIQSIVNILYIFHYVYNNFSFCRKRIFSESLSKNIRKIIHNYVKTNFV